MPDEKALSTFDPTLNFDCMGEREQYSGVDGKIVNIVCAECGHPAAWSPSERAWRHLDIPSVPIGCNKYGYVIEVVTKFQNKELDENWRATRAPLTIDPWDEKQIISATIDADACIDRLINGCAVEFHVSKQFDPLSIVAIHKNFLNGENMRLVLRSALKGLGEDNLKKVIYDMMRQLITLKK